MKTISRYIMTLALLLTAVTGAWADGVTASEIDATVSAGWSSDESLIKASDLPGYNKITLEQAMTWASAPASGTVYLIYEIVADGELKIAEFKHGNYTESFVWSEETHYLIWEDINYGDKRYFYTTGPAASGPEVTIADDNTEASFEMPTSDVTAEYELVRDMSVQMQAQVGDGTQEQPRYRVKKDGNKFIPADMEMAAVPALFTVNDAIEQKALTLNQDYYCLIYKLDEQTKQPEGDGVELVDFDFAPGLYALKAFALDDSDYAGETALSNTFQLFQGYEITVPAGEYATFYKDENLYADTETSADAELYTIASVTDTEAVLSSQINVVAAGTPMLIFNKGTEANTFLLIPTTQQADEVTHAEEFKGSLTEGEIPASSAVTDYYALNGKAFVWVKYAIEIGANKCWLQIGDQPAAARAMTRSIVGGGNTTNMDDVRWQMEDGNYYDLNGRKVEKPNRKGIYIKGGKKVIFK